MKNKKLKEKPGRLMLLQKNKKMTQKIKIKLKIKKRKDQR